MTTADRTDEPTATQAALITAAIRAMQDRHTELGGDPLPADHAKQLLLAAIPYVQNFVVDVEVAAVAGNARKAIEEVGGSGSMWTAGWLDGWDGALASLRSRAAARGAGRIQPAVEEGQR